MNAEPAPRRRLWPWLLGAVAAAAAAVVVLVLVYGRPGTPPASTAPPLATNPPQTAASATPAPTATATAVGVDGCLGGDSRGPQAVLDAQKAAPRTPEGAVSFAIAFYRWAAQKPVVPDSEISQLENTVWQPSAGELGESVRSLEGFNAAQFHVTSVNGYYRIDKFTDDRVELTLMLPLIAGGAVSPSQRLAPSVAVQWSDRGWVIAGDIESADRDTLQTTGVAVVGGC